MAANQPARSRTITDRLDALKFELKADLANSELRLTERIESLRQETHDRFDTVRRETHDQFEAFRQETQAFRQETRDQFEAFRQETQAFRQDTRDRFETLTGDTRDRFEASNRTIGALAQEFKEFRGTAKGVAIVISTLVPVVTALAVLAVNLVAGRLHFS